jgi:serine/threonine-protein kinase
MEFVEGPNLAEVIKSSGNLKVGHALEIFMQICSGLMCAHTNGIIHRDLKPSNVIVQHKQNGQDRAVIVDFGVARILRDATDTVRLTQEGEAFGSPAYMSPEQCLGEELDVRSDVYSLGCLMYEALTGAPPLVGDNVLATVAKQVRETPVSMRAHDSAISEDVDDLVLKCLSKEPLLRYQKASDLRIDLEKIKEGGYVNSSAKRGRKPAKGEKQSGDSQSLRNTEDSYRKVASLVVVVLLAAVLVGGITGGVVWFVMQKQAGTERTVQVPDNPGANGQAKPPSNAVEKPPVKIPTKSPIKPAIVSTPAMQQVNAAPPAKVTVHKPSSSTLTRQKPVSQADAAKHHTAANSRKPPHAQPSNSAGWDQLKTLRVHK